jgi:hypothetical protein
MSSTYGSEEVGSFIFQNFDSSCIFTQYLAGQVLPKKAGI